MNEAETRAELSFEKYKPTSFRQLLEAFKEYKGEI
jgi:hypothetical protein